MCCVSQPGLITEVEACDGPQDRVCHASRGKTPRNAVMFEGGGRWYVYLCYGVHWILNLVTGEPGYPAALLIRSAGPIVGPGCLTRDLAIDGSLNGARAVWASGLWIEPAPKPQAELGTLCSTPRIGIDYAGPEWVARPYRFLLR